MITINDAKCNCCGICVSVCPSTVFSQPKKDVVAIPLRTDHCISCFHCVSICPQDAVSHNECSPDDLEELNSTKIKPEEVKELFLSRRSIRKFKEKDVPDETMEELLGMASQSETGSNLQSEGFIVVRDRKKLESLESLTADIVWNKGFKFMKEKGVLPALLKRKFGPQLWKAYRKYNEQFAYKRKNRCMEGSIFRNAPALVIVHGIAENNMAPQNAAIAVRDMEIIAHSMGLGSCWSGYLVAAADMSGKVNKFLGLDKRRKVLGALMIGYPVYTYKHIIPRKQREIRYI